MGSSAPATSIRYSSGTARPLRESAKPNVAASEQTAPTTSGRSGPMKRAASASGMANEAAATRVIGRTPRSAFVPPPTSITMRIGHTIRKGNAMSACVNASAMASRLVMLASVAVGMPIEPNIVGKPLAMRHERIDVTGSRPSATSMLAGMATAVPKPAMPSRKLPKHQAMSSTRMRRSADTEHSMRLIVSMAPVCTVRL